MSVPTHGLQPPSHYKSRRSRLQSTCANARRGEGSERPMQNRFIRTALALCILVLSVPGIIHAATYEVGPGRSFETPSDVPWEFLSAGDVVLIYWRSAPYKDKWVICREGTEAAPIVIRGVLGPAGERPVIDGSGAVTRRGLDYWNENRGVIKIGGASVPTDTMPRHIVIENLEVRSARPGYVFIDDHGIAQGYIENAAAIYIEKGEFITLRNNRLLDSGNGLFVGSGDPQVSRGILVEGNAIFDNGNVGSAFEHNVYTEALGTTFQFNYLGPLKAGAGGNNLKDRSGGSGRQVQLDRRRKPSARFGGRRQHSPGVPSGLSRNEGVRQRAP